MNTILKNKTININKIWAICFSVITGLVILFSMNFNDFRKTIDTIPLDVEWSLEKDGEFVSDAIRLPYEFDKNDASTYRFKTIIPEINFKSKMLTLFVFYKNIRIYIDGNLIYEHVFIPTLLNQYNSGTGEVRVVLPSGSSGKTLEIEYDCLSYMESSSFYMPEIHDATKNVFSLSTGDIAILFIMIAFLFVAVLAWIVHFMTDSAVQNKLAYLYLGFFFISISIWALCYTRLIELCINNWSLTTTLEYVSFYAIPMSLWLLYEKIWGNKTVLTNTMKYILAIYYSITVFANLVFKIPFTFFISFYHVFLFITIFILVFELIRHFKRESKQYKLFACGMLCFLLAGLSACLQYYFFPRKNELSMIFIVLIATAGVLFVMSVLVLSSETIKNHFHLAISKNRELEYIRYEALFGNSNQTFFDWDTTNDTAYISNNFKELFGVNVNSKKFLKSFCHVVPCLAENQLLLSIAEQLNDGLSHEKIEGSFINTEQEEKFFEMDLTSNYDFDGNRTHVIGIVKDITEVVKLEEEHLKQMQYIDINRQLYDNILEADIENNVLIGDAAEIFADGLGLKEDKSFSRVIKAVTEKMTHPDFVDKYLEVFSRERILSLFNDGINSFQTETYELSADGTYEWLQLNVFIYKSNHLKSVCIMSFVQNITKIKKREFALVESSTKDYLSKLYNKGASMRLIHEVLEKSNEEINSHSLILVDIDEFKGVNDSLGHAMGDTVIIDVSKMLGNFFREEDIVGRFGGDEFVILLKNENDLDVLRKKCRELNEKVYIRYGEGEKSKQISLSIGVACYPQHGTDYETLFANADQAMYESKKKGRNTFTIYGE
ncbi:MAG: diguanylate cyclase [Lachnospiraceae bacterium]